VSRIAIVDRVTLRADDVRSWLDRMHAEYAPAADARGMSMTGAWSSPVDPDAVEVCILWELPDTAAFWRMRAGALADASVERFWDATDAIALERDRRVYEPVEGS
jgi:hypothetical protein